MVELKVKKLCVQQLINEDGPLTELDLTRVMISTYDHSAFAGTRCTA